MRLPTSGGFKYLVQGRCSVSHWPEKRMLRTETAKTLGDWIFEDIICRWGSLCDIVTDNGPPFIKAVEYLRSRYKFRAISISGYNSRANGIVERLHFDVRQALFKAVDGDESKWSQAVHSVFWADRVTFRRRMGCSPYFATTGTHPILPMDIAEANYLLPPPESILSTTDLIARRAIALQKRQVQLEQLHSRVYAARVAAARRFEKEHATTIRDFNFKKGDLVLMRNTQVEMSLNRKMRPRYLGPLVVISRNRGGAYILAELNGTLYHAPVAAFRLIPFFARTSIPLPPLDEFIDVSSTRLKEMEASDKANEDDSEPTALPDDNPELGIPDDEEADVPDEPDSESED